MMSSKPPNRREALTEMTLELRANRVTLAGLMGRYDMFLFTGGGVSRERWDLVAITAYLDRPFAVGGVSPGEVERYRQLAETIVTLGQTVAEGGPRSLRSRRDIADTFGRASTELQRLGGALEAAITEAVGAAE